MYIRHRIQKALLDKSGKEPDTDELPGIVENLKKLVEFNWITPVLIAVYTTPAKSHPPAKSGSLVRVFCVTCGFV